MKERQKRGGGGEGKRVRENEGERKERWGREAKEERSLCSFDSQTQTRLGLKLGYNIGLTRTSNLTDITEM